MPHILKDIGLPMRLFFKATEKIYKDFMRDFLVQGANIMHNHHWLHKTVHKELSNYYKRLFKQAKKGLDALKIRA